MCARKVRADLKVVSVQAHHERSRLFFWPFSSRTSAYYRGEEKHQMDEGREGFWFATTLPPFLSPSPDSDTLLCFMAPRWSFGRRIQRASNIYLGLCWCRAEMLPPSSRKFRGRRTECAVCIHCKYKLCVLSCTPFANCTLTSPPLHLKTPQTLYVQKHKHNNKLYINT